MIRTVAQDRKQRRKAVHKVTIMVATVAIEPEREREMIIRTHTYLFLQSFRYRSCGLCKLKKFQKKRVDYRSGCPGLTWIFLLKIVPK